MFEIKRFSLIDALAQIYPRTSSSRGRSWTAELMIKFDSIDASGLSDILLLSYALPPFRLIYLSGPQNLLGLVVSGIIAF